MKYALTALALVLAAPAYAADMPAKAAGMNSYAAVDPSSWQGFYVGGHLGYGASGMTTSELTDLVGKFNPKGFIGGGQVGHNWQYKNLVAGVEVDATWLNGKDGLSNVRCEGDCGITGKLDFVGTARGRIGLADGAWLFYGTGGLAWGHSAIAAGGASLGNTSFGWVAGGGVEVMFGPHVTARVEYLHYAFGSDLLAKSSLDVGRAGLNFKF